MITKKIVSVLGVFMLAMAICSGAAVSDENEYPVNGTVRWGGDSSYSSLAKLTIISDVTNTFGEGHLEIGRGIFKFQFRIGDTGSDRALVLDRYYGGWSPSMSWARSTGYVGIRLDYPESMLHLPKCQSIQVGDETNSLYVSSFRNITWHDFDYLDYWAVLSNSIRANGYYWAESVQHDGAAIALVDQNMYFYKTTEIDDSLTRIMSVDNEGRVEIGNPLVPDSGGLDVTQGISVTGDLTINSGGMTIGGNADTDILNANTIAPRAGSSEIELTGEVDLNGFNIEPYGSADICIGNCSGI